MPTTILLIIPLPSLQSLQMFDRPLPIVFLVVIVAALGYRRLRIRAPPGTKLPPGPKRLPVVGNAFDMPQENAWLTYTNWAGIFGDIVYAEVFGSPLIFLNSVKTTTEIFERRSTNYADRPPMVSLPLVHFRPGTHLHFSGYGE